MMTGIVIGIASITAVIAVIYFYVRVVADEKLDDMAQGDLGMTKEDA
jgi:hypothetical protein